MNTCMDTKITYLIATTLGTTEGLTGIGLEQIVDSVSGETIARFWNGNLVTVGARTHPSGCDLVSMNSSLKATEGQTNIETLIQEAA
jgi:hypothetical protein